jgi:hypothetical protein
MTLTCLLALVPLTLHRDTISLGELSRNGESTQLQVEIDADRLLQTVGYDRPDLTEWQAEDITHKEQEIIDFFRSHYRLLHADHPLELHYQGWTGIRAFEPILGAERLQRVQLRFAFDAPPGDTLLVVEHSLFLETEIAHRHLLRVGQQANATQVIVGPERAVEFLWEDPSERGLRLRRQRAVLLSIWRWHRTPLSLLFLLALWWTVSTRRSKAHNSLCFVLGVLLTYALGVRNVFHADPQTVLLATAFSVAYLAGENVLVPQVSMRWATALLFGLVHGLSFSHWFHLDLGAPRYAAVQAQSLYLAGVLAMALCWAALLWCTSRTSGSLAQRLAARWRVANGALASLGALWMILWFFEP